MRLATDYDPTEGQRRHPYRREKDDMLTGLLYL
jgi:hypothetical protein